MKELKDLLSEYSGFDREVSQIKTMILKDQELAAYFNKQNIVLSDGMLDKSTADILIFRENHPKCIGCSGLEACKQEMPGYSPELKQTGDILTLVFSPCEFQKQFETRTQLAGNLKSFFMPKKVLNATFDDLHVEGEGRGKAINKLATFAKSYQSGRFMKAVYLSGPFGVGKTYLLAAMANALARRNIKVAFVYTPDMIRELKSAIGKNSLENLVDEIKNIEVLILDDIGSEMNTQWSRDEIMGPILQYRMLEELPTFFSSNKTIEELIRDYALTSDGREDSAKAKRLGDRIMALADEYVVKGKNYRY